MEKRFIKVLDFGVEKEIEVSEEVYLEYMRPFWREDRQRRREREYGVIFSTEESAENGYEVPADYNMEDTLIYKEAFNALREELNQLTEQERDLILCKYDRTLTLEKLSKKYGISVSKAHREQKKLIILIEEKMENFK